MSLPRNEATLLLLDQIETVGVCFGSYVKGMTKLYTYKVKKGEYKVGDMALALMNDGKYKVVCIQRIDTIPAINPNATWEYQWLVQKIDLITYNQCLAAEDAFMNLK